MGDDAAPLAHMPKRSNSRLARSLRTFANIAIFSAVGVPPLGAKDAASSQPGGDGWTLVSQTEVITVYQRTRKDSNIHEVKAVGLINAAPLTVKRVLDDTAEYPHFMPYVTEARVISHSGDIVIGYQRVSPPLISDRDYTMRTRSETQRNAKGEACYYRRWGPANDLGPAEKSGVVRVKVNEGYWLLEPAADGRQTKATYSLYCDSGGSLPAALVNTANRTAVPRIFDGVRKQAKLAKYSAEK